MCVFAWCSVSWQAKDHSLTIFVCFCYRSLVYLILSCFIFSWVRQYCCQSSFIQGENGKFLLTLRVSKSTGLRGNGFFIHPFFRPSFQISICLPFYLKMHFTGLKHGSELTDHSPDHSVNHIVLSDMECNWSLHYFWHKSMSISFWKIKTYIQTSYLPNLRWKIKMEHQSMFSKLFNFAVVCKCL